MFCVRGSAPNPARELTALPHTPWLNLGGRFATGNGGEQQQERREREGREGKVEGQREGEGREREEREGKIKGLA